MSPRTNTPDTDGLVRCNGEAGFLCRGLRDDGHACVRRIRLASITFTGCAARAVSVGEFRLAVTVTRSLTAATSTCTVSDVSPRTSTVRTLVGEPVCDDANDVLAGSDPVHGKGAGVVGLRDGRD